MLDLAFDAPPFRLSGMVYGALLNHEGWLVELGPAANLPPYKSPPKAPVLSIKPRQALVGAGAEVIVPGDAECLVIAATLALVLGRTACRISEGDALDHLAGYTVACDLHLPHDSHYRPALRSHARDGFCPIGPRVVLRQAVADPDRLAVRVKIDGRLAQETSTAGMRRPVARLLADVSEFITLAPGDVLLLGAAAGAPRAAAGQRIEIDIDGLGCLDFRLLAEPQAGLR